MNVAEVRNISPRRGCDKKIRHTKYRVTRTQPSSDSSIHFQTISTCDCCILVKGVGTKPNNTIGISNSDNNLDALAQEKTSPWFPAAQDMQQWLSHDFFYAQLCPWLCQGNGVWTLVNNVFFFPPVLDCFSGSNSGECVFTTCSRSRQTKNCFSVITWMKEIKSIEMIKLDEYIKLINHFLVQGCVQALGPPSRRQRHICIVWPITLEHQRWFVSVSISLLWISGCLSSPAQEMVVTTGWC